MAQKEVDSSLLFCEERGDIINDNVSKSKGIVEDREQDNLLCELNGDKIPECPVCLQTCIHPVRLPCKHIFCFLCVKGAANQSKKCALCRQEIPVDYLNNPALLRKEDLLKDSYSEDGFAWFYEGRNGWWQYDERTSHELEEKYKRDIKVFDLLIAGFLYVIDLENQLQVRRNDPTRRRRIKRDRKDIPKKGVAGLKIADTPPRHGADGIESGEQDDRDSRNANHVVRRSTTNVNSVMNVNNPVLSASPTPLGSGDSSPQAPHNTPQCPSTEGSPHHPSYPSQQDLSARMADMSLDSGRHRNSPGRRDPLLGIPQPGSPTSSSDSDWE